MVVQFIGYIEFNNNSEIHPDLGRQIDREYIERAAASTRLAGAGVAAIGGARGNLTKLVGTPEQVADALLDYCDLGIDHFLIRGVELLEDAIRSDAISSASLESSRPGRETRPVAIAIQS
jgi:alkanesulfonate monooxygenase